MPNPPQRPQGYEGVPQGARIIDLIDARIELLQWCSGCGNKSTADLRHLAALENEMMPLDRLKGRLRCTFCQRRRGEFWVRAQDLPRIKSYR